MAIRTFANTITHENMKSAKKTKLTVCVLRRRRR